MGNCMRCGSNTHFYQANCCDNPCFGGTFPNNQRGELKAFLGFPKWNDYQFSHSRWLAGKVEDLDLINQVYLKQYNQANNTDHGLKWLEAKVLAEKKTAQELLSILCK